MGEERVGRGRVKAGFEGEIKNYSTTFLVLKTFRIRTRKELQNAVFYEEIHSYFGQTGREGHCYQ